MDYNNTKFANFLQMPLHKPGLKSWVYDAKKRINCIPCSNLHFTLSTCFYLQISVSKASFVLVDKASIPSPLMKQWTTSVVFEH